MIINTYFLECMVKERQVQFEREAERARLIKAARKSRPAVYPKWLERFADFMIDSGVRIKARYGMPKAASCNAGGYGAGCESQSQ